MEMNLNPHLEAGESARAATLLAPLAQPHRQRPHRQQRRRRDPQQGSPRKGWDLIGIPIIVRVCFVLIDQFD
jgi:hypothetical protein